MRKNDAENTIIDFISGESVHASPEEIESTQIFSRQLVEDYGYPKEHIQTRPQFRVKARPSDTLKEYPVDIVVFNGEKKDDASAYIIIECKRNNRKDGKSQLEDYLRFSQATMGVWFNGKERAFINKVEKQGKVYFQDIPNIPKYGQRLEDIGKFLRKDLAVPHNLKSIFNAIRNHLAGNFVGATRDEELARELINLIFCKIYDERFTKQNDAVQFRIGVDEDLDEVSKRIDILFENVKLKYSDVINSQDTINLDKNAVAYAIGELQNYCLIDSERDAVADAFETFIGYALKGSQGQFFTPRNVVRLMVSIINPLPTETLIDPACGSGGFLIESLRHMWKKLSKDANDLGWSELALNEEKMTTAIKRIKGIEKDSFLSKVTKAYMTIIGDGKGGIFCEDSLETPNSWKETTKHDIGLAKFDCLLTNPPFGKDINITGEEKLSQYDLAHIWKDSKKTNKIKETNSPQILFIERSIQLLKDGGRIGIILPETIFHAPKTRFVLKFLLTNNNLQWVIDLPHNTFRPYNNAKCIAVILEKNRKQQQTVNMAVAEEMGHNHQGKEIYRWDYKTKSIDRKEIWDDIPLILTEFGKNNFSKYCFKVKYPDCEKTQVFVPRYFWQSRLKEIETLAENEKLQLVPIKELIQKRIITFFDGHGSPPAEYKGMGDFPYIRVKDIVNWEVYKDPTAKLPEEIYMALKGGKKELKTGDVLFVRRGSYRIGSVAMVSPFDTEVALTREILVLRISNKQNEYDLTPYYLLYLLSHKLVGMQVFNKVLIETTLPNIANRWQELMLPISKNKDERLRISQKIQTVMDNKWQAIQAIEQLKEEFGELTT